MRKFNAYLLFAVMSTLTLLLGACGKKEDDGAQPAQEPALTEEILTVQGKSTVQQRWLLAYAEAKYYSPAGKLDSTYRPAVFNTPENAIRFSFGTSGERLYSLSVYKPLNRLIPQLGYWALNSGQQKLSFTKNSLFPGGGPGGTYSYKYTPYGVAANNLFQHGLDLTQVETLGNGGRIEKTISLGAY